MDIQSHILAVLALGAVTLWSAIPVGIVLGLDPWTTGIAAAVAADVLVALLSLGAAGL